MENKDETAQAWAEINIANLQHNLRTVKTSLQTGVKVMTVVKADGYGHGALMVAKVLEKSGVDYLAVANVQEAKQLRQGGISLPILILGFVSEEQAASIVDYDLTVSVYSWPIVQSLAAQARRKERMGKVHVRIDSGFGSDGVPDQEAFSLIERAVQEDGIVVEGVYTHLVAAYGREHKKLGCQLTRFEKVLTQIKEHQIQISLIHAASSPAILNNPETQYNMVRPGIILYGLSVPDSSSSMPLKPVMQLKAKIGQIKNVAPGDTMGYGGTFTVDKQSRVASVPVGYADGLWIMFLKHGEALVNGKRVPILGQSRMDHFNIDVTQIPGAQTGDEVVIFGEQHTEVITAEEVAIRAQIGHMNCDAVCLLGSRIKRVYLEKTEVQEGENFKESSGGNFTMHCFHWRGANHGGAK